MNKIKLTISNKHIILILKNTPTAEIIFNNLPISSSIKFWGEEIYFDTNLEIKLEDNAKNVVQFGDIAFWTEGRSIAIGYGKTPISKKNEIRLVSPCNIWATSKFEKSFFSDITTEDKVVLKKYN